MIVYTENTRDLQKILPTLKQAQQGCRHIRSKHKNKSHFHMLRMNTWKLEFKNIIISLIVTKKVKYLNINVTKHIRI